MKTHNYKIILIMLVLCCTSWVQAAEAFVAGRLLLNAARKSTAVRKSAGTVFNSKAMAKASKSWFKRHGVAGQVPKEVLKKLKLKKFKNFDAFRKAFWREVSRHPKLVKRFNAFNSKNVSRMKKGLAPFVPLNQRVGKLKQFTLHHKKRIADGGSVYDLSNLLIASPRYHKFVHTGK